MSISKKAKLGPTSLSKGKGKAVMSKRPQEPSLEPSSGSEDDVLDDKTAMLAALQAHGMAMFGMPGPGDAETSEQGRLRSSSDEGDSVGEGHEDDEDDEDANEFESDDGWGEGDEMVDDSEEEFIGFDNAPPKPKSSVPEVVFAPSASTKSTTSAAERRAFLKGTSAKMLGIKPESDYATQGKKRSRADDEEDLEDQSNLKLDRTLHDMLSKTLIPETSAATASRPVDKRKAISSRLAQLNNYNLPGEKGDKAELSYQPAKIRTGIIHAQAKREAKMRADAEAAGSFVRGMGGLDGSGRGHKGERGRGQRAGLGEDVGKKKGMASKSGVDRSRGLAGGIGKFDKGLLWLSERDIARGSSRPAGGRGGKRGGNKKRGGW